MTPLSPETVAGSPALRWSFVALTFAVAGLFVAGIHWSALRAGLGRAVARRQGLAAAAGAALWIALTGALAARGALHFEPPPTMLALFPAVLAIAIAVAFSPLGRRLAFDLPLAALVGYQGFRVVVELLMHRAYVEGLMPVQMSYSGRNFDIVSGMTAVALGAWLAARGEQGSRRIVLLWNTLGVVLLANILIVALLSAPTPMRVFLNEPADTWIARAPWVWLPAVMVLAAISGHALVYRRLLRARTSAERRATPGPERSRATGTIGVALCGSLFGSVALAQGGAAEWTLSRLYSVGGESDAVVLHRVQSVQLLRDHRLLIADIGAKSIVVVDSLGRSRPPLGRTGSGPAEYRTPQALATIGDSIAVLDPGNARIGLFTTGGAWQGSWTTQLITGGSDVRLYRVPEGGFYGIGTRRAGARTVMTFIRYDARGARDTLAPEPPSVTPDYGAMCEGSDRGLHFFATTFQSRHLRIPGPRGTLLDADMSTYRIVQHSLAGEIVATFTGPATRVHDQCAACGLTNADADQRTPDCAAFRAAL